MSKSGVDREFDLEGVLSEDMESIHLTGATAFKRLFSALVGQNLRVRFVVFRKKRSDAQNRYIHGVMVPVVRDWIRETTGEKKTHDEVYLWLRTGILGQTPVISEVMGTQVITMSGKRFSAMNTKEFAEAIEFIADELAAKDCYVPMPKENNFLHEHITKGTNS